MDHNTEIMTYPVEGLPLEGYYLINGACQNANRLLVALTSFKDKSMQEGAAHLLQYELRKKAWTTLLSMECPDGEGVVTRSGPLDQPVAGFGAFGVSPKKKKKPLIWASPYATPKPLLLISSAGSDFLDVDIPDHQGGAAPAYYDLKYLGDIWAAIPVFGSAASGTDSEADGEPVMFLYDDSTDVWRSHSLPPNLEGSGIVQGSVVFNGLLYLAVADAEGGFQLWKTDPHMESDWACVLDQGAGRYVRNQGIWQMAMFQDALYLSTGPARTTNYGPRDGAEIIRLLADDQWELIVGEPRFSTIGLQIPYGVMGPGFDEDGQVIIPGLASFEGRLWALSQIPPGEGTAEDASDKTWRMDLWSSANGEDWEKEETAGELLDNVCGDWPRSLCPVGPGLLITGLFSAEDSGQPELRFLKTAGK